MLRLFSSKLGFLVVAALMYGAPRVDAVGCFSGGETGDCSSAISGFCNMAAGIPYNAGQSITSCTNLNGFRCNFAMDNTGGGGAELGVQQCIDDMTATNNGCNGHGGIRADGVFHLTLDPNAGAC